MQLKEIGKVTESSIGHAGLEAAHLSCLSKLTGPSHTHWGADHVAHSQAGAHGNQVSTWGDDRD